MTIPNTYRYSSRYSTRTFNFPKSLVFITKFHNGITGIYFPSSYVKGYNYSFNYTPYFEDPSFSIISGK